MRPRIAGVSPGDVARPMGINRASIGAGRFIVAAMVAAAWTGLSLWLAVPWVQDFGEIVGPPLAWALIFGIALAPGFMNAFHTASLLMRLKRRYFAPAQYPRLTLLIAAFNEAPGVAQTLRSIQAQRYAADLELIVIDDGSTDGTVDVVRSLDDPRIRVLVLQKNGGKASALNRGLEEASCELIVTVDADCELHPDALRFLVEEYLNGQPQTAAVAGAVFVQNARSNWLTRLQHWDYFHGIAATKHVQSGYGGTLVAQGAFSLYRRSILREIGGWPQGVGEDIVVTWAILRRGWFVGYAADALCFTSVPESLTALARQRVRWARGMIEAFRSQPGILLKRRLTTFLVSWNLLFPWMDFAFTFGFIPGLLLAAFGHYWLVGPVTLMLLPSAAVVAAVMYRTSTQVFAKQGMRIQRDLPALIAYTIGYSLILQPVSFGGYAMELLGMRKTWGTK